jgi:hypothetical protein
MPGDRPAALTPTGWNQTPWGAPSGQGGTGPTGGTGGSYSPDVPPPRNTGASVIETFTSGQLVPTQKVTYYNPQGEVTRVQEPVAKVNVATPENPIYTYNPDTGGYYSKTGAYFSLGPDWREIKSRQEAPNAGYPSLMVNPRTQELAHAGESEFKYFVHEKAPTVAPPAQAPAQDMFVALFGQQQGKVIEEAFGISQAIGLNLIRSGSWTGVPQQKSTAQQTKTTPLTAEQQFDILHPGYWQSVTGSSQTTPTLGIGMTQKTFQNIDEFFAPSIAHTSKQGIPAILPEAGKEIFKGGIGLVTGPVDILTGLPQTGGRAVERVLAVTTPYGLLPQGQKAREEGVADIGKGFISIGSAAISNPVAFFGQALGGSMVLGLAGSSLVKTKAEGEVNAVVMKTAPEGTDITNLVAVEGKYNVETSIGGVRVAGKKINIEGLQSSVELPTPKAYGGGTATVSEAGYTPAGGIVKTDVLAGTFGTAGGKEFVDVGALSKLPRMEFPATVSEAGYHAGLIIPEETAARFSTIGRVAGGEVVSSEGLMVRAGEIALPGVQYNRFFSYADLSGGAKGTVFSDILVKQLTGTAGGTEGTFTPGGLIEISKSMQGTVIQAGAAQQAGVLGTIQAGGLGLGLAGEGLQLKSGVAGMLGFTEPLKYATVSTQQITQAKTATETKTIPVVSLGQAERTAQVSLEGIMPAGTTATRTAELTKIIPATSIWEGTSSLEKTMPVNILKPAEVEKVMPASSMFQGQVEVQIPVTASLTKTIQADIFTPVSAPFTFEPSKPLVGGGNRDILNVPKSGFRRMKERRGFGLPLPWATIFSTQRTQARTGGISHQPALDIRTITAWGGAVTSGRGLRTPEESRGFGRIRISAFSKRKKRRKGLLDI